MSCQVGSVLHDTGRGSAQLFLVLQEPSPANNAHAGRRHRVLCCKLTVTYTLPTYVCTCGGSMRIGWWFWEKLFFLIQKGFVIYTQEIVLHFIPVSIVFCRFAIEFCLPNLYFRLSRKPLVTGSSWIRTSSNLSRESLSTRFFLRRWASTQLGQIPKESSRNITTSWRYVCIIDCMTN